VNPPTFIFIALSFGWWSSEGWVL